MRKILYLTNVIRSMGMMQQTLDELQRIEKMSPDCACCWITDSTAWDENWSKELKNTNFLMLRWMGTGLETPFLKRLKSFLDNNKIPYYLDVAGKDEELSYGLPLENLADIKKYVMFGGEQNYTNLWCYLDALSQGQKPVVEAPTSVHWCGIFHPRAQKVYEDLHEYQRDFCNPDKPTVGVFFYRDEWVWGDLTYQTSFVEALEKQGINPICVFTNGMPDPKLGAPSLPEVVEKFFCEQGMPIIDTLVNVMKFSMTSSGSMSLECLEKWNVPVLQAYTIMSAYEEWSENFEGMNAMEISVSVALPEFDGIIHGVPIACKKVLDNGDVRYLPIQERVERMASKAAKWARLRRKENSTKKIAIIFHNYPPKNSNIGSAYGMDSIESIRRVLEQMQQRGYQVTEIPQDTKKFIRELTANATNDIRMMSEKKQKESYKFKGEKYKAFFSSMPSKVQEQLRHDWSEAPGELMEYEGNIIVPGTMYGNVFITVQPERGFGADPEKIYHDPFIAPTHQYLAFYAWLRDVWQADAVAHIGTHGNLEWLPGKNAGLSNGCYPDLAIRDLPNVYPYNITITGEGIQAKRRGAACLIEHLPAPQTQAGVYDELEELEKMMEEYIHFSTAQPDELPRLETLVKEKVEQANLSNEVPYEEDKPFIEYIGALHNYISDLKNMVVHNGLHIMGQPPEDDQLVDYLWLLTRLDNGNIPSLMQGIANLYGFDYYELLENSSLIYEPLNFTYGMLIDRINEQSRELIQLLKDNDFTSDAWNIIASLSWVAAASEEQKAKLKQVTEYICAKVYPNLQLCTNEIENMLRAFEGEYIEPGPSGAPSSGGADLLPTGCNFFGIDPRTLPTPAAWEIGKQLGEQVIERFIAEEGHYPENIGIVLWAGSNMRSHGQCIAEILYLMGVKPKWQSGSLRVNGLEVIPLTELQRPRIDVMSRISGLFRDSMPSLVDLLDKAVLLVAAQEEDEDLNYVRKHINADSKDLEEQEGMSKEDAWRQAAFRIFGDQDGCYGAGVATLLEAKNWETIDDIADVYVRWGAHAYGGKTRGKFLPQQFRKRLGRLDITIKNEDNHETNMLSSDDYNAYHGGMIACVRSIKGSAPRSYCGDSTDSTKVKIYSVQEQAKRIFRSESINPKFIEGMMKHGYKGAADMANMLAHSYQWDATSAVMEDWMYEKYAEKYAFDPKVQEWLREVNPWALQRMTEILLEAEQRGLWQARLETKAELEALYLDIEGEVEELADD